MSGAGHCRQVRNSSAGGGVEQVAPSVLAVDKVGDKHNMDGDGNEPRAREVWPNNTTKRADLQCLHVVEITICICLQFVISYATVKLYIQVRWPLSNGLVDVATWMEWFIWGSEARIAKGALKQHQLRQRMMKSTLGKRYLHNDRRPNQEGKLHEHDF
jgi:hypothetical protein